MKKSKMFIKQAGKSLMIMLFIACVAISSVHAVDIYNENFESGSGGWFADNGVWEVGEPTSGPGSAHGGTQCAGTNLGGYYSNSVDSLLSGPSIRLPGVSGDEEIHLRFWQWYNYRDRVDKGFVQISVYDDVAGTWSDWSDISSVIGLSSVWALGGADLTSYANKKIKIGFYHKVNASSFWEGWYIDDIQVYKKIPQFTSNFESGWGDWFPDNGVWEVGDPTSGPGSAHGGGQCAGTNLGGYYHNSVNSRLISPSVRLCEVIGDEEIHLRYWQWYNYQDRVDKGFVQISVYDDAAGTWSDWSDISSVIGLSSVWALGGADLTSYADKKIRIGFYHKVNTSSFWEGWYVDDVEITCIAGPPQSSGTVRIDQMWSANFGGQFLGEFTSGDGLVINDMCTVIDENNIEYNVKQTYTLIDHDKKKFPLGKQKTTKLGPGHHYFLFNEATIPADAALGKARIGINVQLKKSGKIIDRDSRSIPIYIK